MTFFVDIWWCQCQVWWSLEHSVLVFALVLKPPVLVLDLVFLSAVLLAFWESARLASCTANCNVHIYDTAGPHHTPSVTQRPSTHIINRPTPGNINDRKLLTVQCRKWSPVCHSAHCSVHSVRHALSRARKFISERRQLRAQSRVHTGAQRNATQRTFLRVVNVMLIRAKCKQMADRNNTYDSHWLECC